MAAKQDRTVSSSTSKRTSPVAETDDNEDKVPYLELWNEGIECGLIGKNRPSEKRYYHMVYRKSLERRLEAYKKASKEKKVKLAASFESNLQFQCENQAKEEKEAKGQPGQSKTNLAPRPPTGYQPPVWPATQGVEHRRPSENKREKPKHRVEEDYTEISATLVSMWQRGLDSGLIVPENTFHRGIVGFITPSELSMLLRQYSSAAVEVKEAMSQTFNEELTSFNANIPSVARYFKASRPYAEVWTKAAKSGLIPESTKYNAEYAEWISSKDLLAYTHTLKTILTREDRTVIRTILFDNNIKPKLEFADSCLEYRASLNASTPEDLVKECEKSRPEGSATNAYSKCKRCTSLLVKTDVIAAVSAWAFCSEEEASVRYQRWHNFRLALHTVECPDEEASAKYMRWRLSRETPLIPKRTDE